MPFGVFEKALNRWPTVKQIAFMCLGEPLIQPEVLPMLSFCAPRGLIVDLTTNGMALTGESARALARTPGWLCLSVDSVDQQVLNKATPGIDFAVVAENIRAFNRVVDRHPERRLFVNVVVTSETKNTLVETARAVLALGVVGIRVIRAQGSDVTGVQVPPEDDPVVVAALATIQTMSNGRLDDAFTGRTVPWGGAGLAHCNAPWTQLVVCGNGNVTTCCHSDVVLGHLDDSVDPFFGLKATALRDQLSNSEIDPGLHLRCATCQQAFPLDWPLLHAAQKIAQVESTVALASADGLVEVGLLSLSQRLRALDSWVEQTFTPTEREQRHHWVRWRVLGLSPTY